MINALLSGIFGIITSLVGTILKPIDSLISGAFPNLSSAISAINSLIDYLISVIGYAVDASGLSSLSITLIVGYYTFVIGTTLVLFIIKLALKWYDTLKP